MKRSRLRKKSNSNFKKIEDELWKECKRIVDEQFGTNCFTCSAKNLQGRNKQLGHMIPKATLGAALKYDIRLLRNQCFRCNIHGGGMGAEFYRKMMAEQGPTYMSVLMEDRKIVVKASEFYPKLLEEYKLIKR